MHPVSGFSRVDSFDFLRCVCYNGGKSGYEAYTTLGKLNIVFSIIGLIFISCTSDELGYEVCTTLGKLNTVFNIIGLIFISYTSDKFEYEAYTTLVKSNTVYLV